MKKNKIAAIHAAIIVIAYSSPFWLDWRVVAVGVGLYWLQILIFKSCVLTIAEFNSTDVTFVGHYLQRALDRFGIQLNQRITKLFLNWGLPPILVVAAYLIQT